MNLDKYTIRKVRGLIVFTVLFLIGVYRFEVVVKGFIFLLDIVFPFILGGAIAFILSVPMGQIRKLLFAKIEANPKGKRGERLAHAAAPISLVLSIILVIFLLFILTAVVLPELAYTLSTLAKTLPVKFTALLADLELFLADYPDALAWVQSVQIDWEQLFVGIVDFFRSGATAFLGSTIGVAKGIVSAFTTFFIAFVFACYILLQKETLGRQLRKVLYAYLPAKNASETLRVGTLTHKIFSNFVTGQCMEAVILGFMFFISMSVLRFPYAVLVGVLIAFAALIPIFGAFIGCIVGTFLILTVNPAQAVAFVILFLVLQQIEGNLIYPHVVGGSVGLPSIWVLAAVSLGGSLFGVVGMLVFIPIISVLYTLLRESVNRKLKEKELRIE